VYGFCVGWTERGMISGHIQGQRLLGRYNASRARRPVFIMSSPVVASIEDFLVPNAAGASPLK